MEFWKKKKPKETNLKILSDELTEIINNVKGSALDVAILRRDIEIIADEWDRFLENSKRK